MAGYRVGRRGRTIYHQRGDEPADTDPLIGVMDHPALSSLAVIGMNGDAGRALSAIGGVHWGRAAVGTSKVYCAACGKPWPCLTRRLITGESPPEPWLTGE